MLRIFPWFAIALLLFPVCIGLIGVALPAFGYFPALESWELSLVAWRELFSSPGIETSIFLTVWIALVSTGLSWMSVHIIFALSWQGRWLRKLSAYLSPLLAAPHAAFAVGLVLLCAPSGWLVRLMSPWATGWERPPDLLIVNDPFGLMMSVGLALKETPFLLLIALSSYAQERVPEHLLRARALGYGSVQAWLRIGAPLIRPHMVLPLLAVLAFATSTVDVTLILGPNTPPPLAVIVLEQFEDPDLSRRFSAAAGALLQLFLTFGIAAFWFGSGVTLRSLLGFFPINWLLPVGHRGGALKKTWVGFMPVAFLLLTAFGSFLCLLLWAVAGRWRFPSSWPETFSLRAFDLAATRLDGTLTETLLIAGLATLIAIVLTLACLENEVRRGVGMTKVGIWLLYTPLIVPQLPFLFGLQVVGFTLGMNGTLEAVIFGHLIFVIPYMFLTLSEPYRGVDPRLIMAARTLGRGPWATFFHVRLPILLRPLLIALALGLSVSVALYLPTVLLGTGRISTIAIETVQAAAGGDRRVMGVLALVQAAVPMLAFGLAWALPAVAWRNRSALKG